MQERTHQTEYDSFLLFDPIIILRDVLRRWYLIVTAALILGMGAWVLSDYSYTPSYTTTTTFVATSRGASTTVYQNLSAATNLASVFEEVLNSSILRTAILEELDMTSFGGTIQASVLPETNLLILRVTDTDPRTAFLVTRSIIENHHIVSYQVLGDTVLEVLQEPVVPTAPSNFNRAPSHARQAALLAGGVMFVLLAVLSYLKDTVRSRQEAEAKLNCRCLGELRHEQKYKTLITRIRRRKTSILITKPATSFHFVESVRKLRRRVEQQLGGAHKVLLVTSVLENEGKSTVAVNLALSMAQKHSSVLLIDCDLRKPACYKLLDRPCRGSGTLDTIAGRCELDAVLTKEETTGLHLLLEHRSVRSATNLVGSAGMAALLTQCRRRFDYIIVDMPPMTAAPDSESIIEHADGALLVVQQNASNAGQINRAAEVLNGREGKLLGCIINNVYTSPLSGSGGYGYGYYGRYGKYGKYGTYGKYGGYDTAASAEKQ